MSSFAMEKVPSSEIRVMFDAAKKLEAEGKKLVHMEIGRPDMDTPAHIVEAAVKALRNGEVHYASNAGILPLREAIADKYDTEHQLSYDPYKNILVTNGVAEGVYLAISALLNPGDEILIPDPVWLNYNNVPVMNFIHPVSYTLTSNNSFLPDINELKEKVTNHTKMLVLLSPSNPTGAMLTHQAINELASFAKENDLIVLSDEIYEKIIYDSKKHISIATVKDMKERTIILNGFSKFYSMTGWRIGYALGNEKYIQPMLKMHQYINSASTTFAQWGALEALTGDQTPSIKMVKQFEKRRNFFVKSLNEIPGFQCPRPDGAFYVFPSIKETGMSSKEMSQFLLEKAHVVSVAGSSFGKSGEGHIRFSYTASLYELEIAVHHISKAMKDL
ncbi:pyridoxal phosphate-dependent aminotransferase [Oceanobacillus sp. J11TS1]|uniref:pyridoxal phosphate-dependent aminotransferase n=1 Tax=Oceanobacillus sp. J11TS1 TaxID=2807191 RepID=UPI001AFDAFB8|nr:pyridoxal phosphate-dependent aminotransferase [Oceanobacillus sp. J11TS1]GIO24151.1 aminotransferase [Oceanobacillus sp. J11TS1]